MGVRKVRYIIEPWSACPAGLLFSTASKIPGDACDFDTELVAACATGEVLQTGGTAGPLSLFFDQLLVPGEERLIWRGSGPGRGKEMRRAFSGLFGRFFARAYLTRYHDFVWFASIDGEPAYISERVRVARVPGKTKELPDWMCAGPGKLAIAEAKGV